MGEPLRKELVQISRTTLTIASADDNVPIFSNVERQWQSSFRAARLVGDSTRFLVVTLARGSPVLDGNAFSIAILYVFQHDRIVMKDNCTYTFLGFTESHLKANQFVLFREDGDDWTAKKLRKMLGDLDSVYRQSGYGKYAARLGLSFSSTAVGISIPLDKMVLIDDRFAEDGSIVSDGCGMIRDSAAQTLCETLRISADTTVFQVRIGGIKGILARYPDDLFDELVGMGGKLVAYRPSMLKYESDLNDIEVCNVSRKSGRARLNIQFIILLLSLGISIDIFKELLQEQLEDIALFMQDRTKAIEMLQMADSAELDAEGKGFNQELFEMLLAGHDLNEPYMKMKMESFQNTRYKTLQEKLSIDVKTSVRLFGIVDELGVLKQDEVYINLPRRSGPVIGRVAVARNPCYATGDIRVLRAVNKSELSHLQNCIVFPSLCSYSVPDTMGGGDLDGDDYWITWDPRLIPPESDPPEKRQQPNNSPKNDMDRPLSNMVSDACNIFCDLRGGARGLLGALSDTWTKSISYSGNKLARSPLSRAFVPLIEQVMDIAKNGANVAELRERFEILRKEHWRVTKQNPKSDPLDELRAIIPAKQGIKMEHYTPDRDLNIRILDPIAWNQYYNDAVGLLSRFGAELAGGIEMDKAEESPDTDSNSHLEKHADQVKRRWREKYFSGLTRTDRSQEELRASAWYYYAYSKEKSAFAWLGARYLNFLKAEATVDGRLPLAVGRISRPLIL